MKAHELIKKVALTKESLEKYKNFKELRRFQNIINIFSRCALCQNTLRFVYFKQKPNTITERAHCDCCNKSSTTRTYNLN